MASCDHFCHKNNQKNIIFMRPFETIAKKKSRKRRFLRDSCFEYKINTFHQIITRAVNTIDHLNLEYRIVQKTCG